jgi:hypothetical protein
MIMCAPDAKYPGVGIAGGSSGSSGTAAAAAAAAEVNARTETALAAPP